MSKQSDWSVCVTHVTTGEVAECVAHLHERREPHRGLALGVSAQGVEVQVESQFETQRHFERYVLSSS